MKKLTFLLIIFAFIISGCSKEEEIFCEGIERYFKLKTSSLDNIFGSSKSFTNNLAGKVYMKNKPNEAWEVYTGDFTAYSPKSCQLKDKIIVCEYVSSRSAKTILDFKNKELRYIEGDPVIAKCF